MRRTSGRLDRGKAMSLSWSLLFSLPLAPGKRHWTEFPRHSSCLPNQERHRWHSDFHCEARVRAALAHIIRVNARNPWKDRMQPSRFAIVQDAGPAKLNEQHRPDRRSFPPEEYYMRFLPRLLMLVSLAALLAHAELLDDVHQRGALRIALRAPIRRSTSSRAASSPASRPNWANCWPPSWRSSRNSSPPNGAASSPACRAASTTSR